MVSVNGGSDSPGRPWPLAELSFTTGLEASTDPNAATSGKSDDPPVPPLQAGPGVTALSGQVRTVGGKYLQGVTLELNCGEKKTDTKHTVSDGTRRVLMARLPTGHSKLAIRATTVNTVP